jgi:hypothetical protein
MKHILNDLSEEEKNRIREQHTGGKKFVIENFDKLVNTRLGDAKPFLNEEQGPKEGDSCGAGQYVLPRGTRVVGETEVKKYLKNAYSNFSGVLKCDTGKLRAYSCRLDVDNDKLDCDIALD